MCAIVDSDLDAMCLSNASVGSSWDVGVCRLKKTIKIHKWLQAKELSVNFGFRVGYLLRP
jgi:hypothetical protein